MERYIRLFYRLLSYTFCYIAMYSTDITASIFLLVLLAEKNYGVLFFKMLEGAYPGCNRKDLFGKMMCGLMGFLDGFIGGVLIALIYNNMSIKY